MDTSNYFITCLDGKQFKLKTTTYRLAKEMREAGYGFIISKEYEVREGFLCSFDETIQELNYGEKLKYLSPTSFKEYMEHYKDYDMYFYFATGDDLYYLLEILG